MPANYIPGAPLSGEYPPFAEAYITKTGGVVDPEATMALQLKELLALLHGAPSAKHDYRYAPGKWTMKEVLGHIIDAERLFAARLLRIARGDQTPLPPFEQDDYVLGAQSDKCAWTSLVSEFQHLRESNILMVRHFPAEAWNRRGTVSGHPVSARGLAYLLIGHAAWHIEVFHARYL